MTKPTFERAARRNPGPLGPGQASYQSVCGKELAARYRSGESPSFEEGVLQWDARKNDANRVKHGVSFYEAQQAFLDSNRIIARDLEHSKDEIRYYCFGKVNGMIMTVRFTYRDRTIRIFGAGYWRQGRKIYEKTQR